MLTIKYFYTSNAIGVLEINDKEDIYLEANTDEGMRKYLGLRVEAGFVTMFTHGMIPLNKPISNYSLSIKRFKYSRNKIEDKISTFLNVNKEGMITQVRQLSYEEFTQSIANPLKVYLEPYRGENYEGNN